MKFEPKTSIIYHLYERDNDVRFLSIISPNEWNKKNIGYFKLKYNRKWEKIQ